MTTTPPNMPTPAGTTPAAHPPAYTPHAPAGAYDMPPPTGAPAPGAQVASSGPEGPVSDKTFLVTWLLSWLLGGLGVDRFYLGKIGTGLLKLVTFGGFGIWVLIDLILVLTGATRDKQGRRLAGYAQHRKIAWIVTGALVALSLVISAISGAASGGSSSTDDAALDAPADVAAEEPAEESPAPEEPAPEPEPAEPRAADWAAEQFGTFEPVSFSGDSDDVLPLPAGVSGGLVTVSHDSDGHFAASVLDANNQPTAELLVNVVGAYAGTTAWGIGGLGEPASLEITASGPWTVTFSPIATASSFDGNVEGSGDQVLLYEGGAATMAISNDGSGHFAVTQDTGSAFEWGLLVNEVGAYSGNVAVSAGPAVIVVTSDGSWSITAS